MWECQKCCEAIEDSFDTCWNCGTSREGAEDPAFHMETDAADQVASPEVNRRWNGFWAGAIVAAVLGYANGLIPYLVAFPTGTPAMRSKLGRILIGTAFLSLFIAGGGGIAGWLGGRARRLGVAAYRGALVILATHGWLILLTGVFRFFQMPPLRIGAVLVNMLALGAIAGCVGAVFGRPRHVDATTDSVQYSLSDMLFLTVLFSLLFGSLAILVR